MSAHAALGDVLAMIDADEVEATRAERAVIAGAVASLNVVEGENLASRRAFTRP